MSTSPTRPAGHSHFLSLPDLAARPATFGHKGQVYDGWETRRRRGATADSHDFAIVRLGVPGIIRGVVVDTAYFIGNAPGSARLRGRDGDGEWFDLLPQTALQPDTRHRFLIDPDVASTSPVTDARLDTHPDGGMARLRLFGRLTQEGLRRVKQRWDASG